MIQIGLKSNVDAVVKQLNDLGLKQVPFATALALTRTAGAAAKAVNETSSRVFDRPTPTTLRAARFMPAIKNGRTATVYIQDEAPKGTSPEKFLMAEVEGGLRRRKRSERVLEESGLMPRGWQWTPSKFAPLDQYGNVPGPYLVRLLSILRAWGEQGFRANETDKTEGRRKKRQRSTGHRVDYFAKSPGQFSHGIIRHGQEHLPPGIYERHEFRWGSSIRPILFFTEPRAYRVRLPLAQVVEDRVDVEFPAQFQAAMVHTLATARK